jgi:hypothetical protein
MKVVTTQEVREEQVIASLRILRAVVDARRRAHERDVAVLQKLDTSVTAERATVSYGVRGDTVDQLVAALRTA